MTPRSCLVGGAIWLLIVTIPFAVVLFAIRGEVSWRRGPIVEDRLWLVNLNGGAGEESASGVAYSATRLVDTPPSAAGQMCARTQVHFWLWRGHSDAVDYCVCYQPRPAPQTGFDQGGTCS